MSTLAFLNSRKPNQLLSGHNLTLEFDGKGVKGFAEHSEDIALYSPTIKLRSLTKKIYTIEAPNGAYFSTKDLLDAIITVERADRPNSNFNGRPDTHHIHFEGLERDNNSVYTIKWGS